MNFPTDGCRLKNSEYIRIHDHRDRMISEFESASMNLFRAEMDLESVERHYNALLKDIANLEKVTDVICGTAVCINEWRDALSRRPCMTMSAPGVDINRFGSVFPEKKLRKFCCQLHDGSSLKVTLTGMIFKDVRAMLIQWVVQGDLP